MPEKPMPILSVCLNPAWQKTLFFARVTPGAVNRARDLRESGGGKGVNLARALRCRNAPVTVALFAGGDTGRRLLTDLETGGAKALAVAVPGATRTCVTIVDETTGAVTELIEPSLPVPAAAGTEMEKLLRAQAGKCAGVALCGTYPPGVSEGLYLRAAEAARNAGIPVLLDSIRQVKTTLASGIDLLKINRAELAELTGEASIEAGCARILNRFRVSWIGITDGPQRAFLAGRETGFAFRLPPLPRCRNTIGAGDCASGIFLAEIAARIRQTQIPTAALPPEVVAAAFAQALAAASASCMTDLPAVYAPREQQTLKEKIVIEKLDLSIC